MLILGDSGKGKTGALASLAQAGYSLRVLDFDSGFIVALNIIRHKCPEALERTYFETLTDSFKNVQGRLVARTPVTAWSTAARLLSNWKTEDYDLGPVTSWGEDAVLVIDSLTHAGYAAMRFQQALNSKLGTNPTLPDWGIVQTMMLDLLSMLYSDDVKCHVIVNTHIDWRWEDVKNEKGQVINRVLSSAYPSAPGNKLPEKIGAFFNNALQVVSSGTGTAERRQLITIPQDVLGLKNSNPGKVKRTYPIDTGLAEFFTDVRS